MEILSDSTFRGNLSISGGAFFVTPKGYVNPLIETTTGSNDGCFFVVHGSEFFNGDLIVNGGGHIELNSSGSINYWSDLNDILDFAPKSLSSTVSSLSSTVSSNTSNINTACHDIRLISTKVDSMRRFGRCVLDFDVPTDCTKFVVYPANGSLTSVDYMFMTKGNGWTSPMGIVNVDLEARCDSSTDNRWAFVVTKSSGFAMCANQNYTIGYFY